MRRAAAWTFGLLLVAVIVFCLLNPFLAGLIFAEVTGQGFGHPQKPPALAGQTQGLTWNQIASRWNAIVQRHFQRGMKVNDMLMVLKAQGFKIDARRQFASYEWGGMPCLDTLYLRWQEDEVHRITAIDGGANEGCL